MPILRLATSADHSALAALFVEMQAHYQVPCPEPDAVLAGLAERPAGAELLLAEHEGDLLGFAAFAPIYPGPGLQPGFFLKELYVAASARGGGIGAALMRELARLALERGFQRIDFTAARDDQRLRRFYEELGAAVHPEKVFYRITGEALTRLGADAET
ncbi:GNAT family N-acetyltransferase [Bosea caraganae]|uniref:GNAT family N-acetyltransferase n=1 Tax=Bosea caraganae TaxID=2763117 RepID=A0A370L3F5_9HYPH|nr:GNAT family N-acetyltransferase [Bosea caraganae]RDJ22923.1 GNAT family N-acetyltransferase [Bosea caraganae]RDJ28703.1 GNAT family N-acetyltransferase [Bosea caraganae]